ncbi:ATP-binding protein [Mycolicibacterium acapulense]|nr:ATP-binding protein [Mycolicibacterium acapulense]
MSCVTPSAARLTDSLRDIGYDFSSAIADLVDNSITAGATEVDIVIEFEGESSKVFIADNGHGMTLNGLTEALRFGSRRAYGRGDLGRYGLGLKTASLSQGRCLTVVTRTSSGRRVIQTRQLDLDLVAEYDDWLIIEPEKCPALERARNLLEDAPGTVVIWEKLDRVLPVKNSNGGWARRRFETLPQKVVEHLSMVFHKFLSGEVASSKLVITVNGQKLKPWDPFARREKETRELPRQRFEIDNGGTAGTVTLRRFVLPGRDKFSSVNEFERLSGPLKWNRQQGLYIYRAGRLVQWGGWAGIRSIDEHTKLARASLEFDTDLDEAFNINVAKMRVSVPGQLRQMIERPINEICSLADDLYRKSTNSKHERDRTITDSFSGGHDVGLALKGAAVEVGEIRAFKKIAAELRKSEPEIAKSLNL